MPARPVPTPVFPKSCGLAALPRAAAAAANLAAGQAGRRIAPEMTPRIGIETGRPAAPGAASEPRAVLGRVPLFHYPATQPRGFFADRARRLARRPARELRP